MEIMIVSALMLITGIVVDRATYSREWEVGGFLAALTGGVMLFICCASIPLSRMGERAFMAEVEAIRSSRQVSMANEHEAVAWRLKVADTNARLASHQFYNQTIFDLWIPDEIDDVQPIR